MSKTLEELVTENIELKKAIALSKVAIDRTQYQYSFLKETYEELDSRYQSLKKQYTSVSNSHRSLQRKNLDDSKYMEERVNQLRDLVETKQRQIQEIQLKILPTLDEDMIKIKVIKEIEQPYLQQLQKKNQEIQTLKKFVYQNQKKFSLLKLQYDDEKLNHEKEVQQLRLYHLNQIKTVNGSLNQIVQWNESKQKDKQTIRFLKRSLQQARRDVQLTKNQLQDIRRQSDALRTERNQLLLKMTSVESGKNGERVKLQLERLQLCQKIKSHETEIDRMNNQITKLRSENRKIKQKSNDLQDENSKVHQQMRQTKLQLLASSKQVERFRHLSEQLELKVSSKEDIIRQLQKQQTIRLQQLSVMEQKVRNTNNELENKQYNYRKEMEEFNHQKMSKAEEKIQTYENIIKQLKQENLRLKRTGENINSNRRESIRDQRTEKQHEEEQYYKIRQLQKNKTELQEKLKQASATIVKLLKQKMNPKGSRTQRNSPDRRMREDPILSRMSPVKLLAENEEYRPSYEQLDAALVPLVPIIPLHHIPRNIYIPTRF